MNFVFQEASHVYYVDGREIPGVTRCLDHAGLVDFRFVREEILARRSALGTEVHKAVELWYQNDLDMKSVSKEATGYLESFIEFAKTTEFLASLVEFQTVGAANQLEYGMKLDLAGRFPKSSRTAIIDLKTGAQYWWHGIQLAGYAAGLPNLERDTPLGRFLSRDRFALHLHPDGSLAKLIPYADNNDFWTFISALTISHRRIAEGQHIQAIEF